MTIAIIILFICNIILCILYARKCTELKQYIENQQKENYIKLQNAEQLMFTEQNKRATTLRHDMKNIFIALGVFMENQNCERVKNIIDETIHVTLARPDYVNSVDENVNKILNYKMFQAKQAGVSLCPELLLTDEIKIDSEDLSIILGIVIDNGIEYLTSSKLEPESKKLSVSMRYDFGMLHITISNPVTAELKIPSDFILPSAKYSGKKGYGISYLKKIVKKQEGILHIDCKDYKFVYDISLPDKKS